MCRRRGGKCRCREVPAPGRKVPAPGRKVPAPGSSCAGEESAGAGNKFESNKANKNEIHKNQLTNWIHHIKFPFWDPCCPKSKSSLTKPKWMMLFTQVRNWKWRKRSTHTHTADPFHYPKFGILSSRMNPFSGQPLIETGPPPLSEKSHAEAFQCACHPQWSSFLKQLHVFDHFCTPANIQTRAKGFGILICLRLHTLCKKILYFEWSPPWHLYVLILAYLLAFHLVTDTSASKPLRSFCSVTC